VARARVYGEVTTVGARQLVRAIGLRDGDRFVDFGSGVGKLVLYVALAVPGVLARGFEIDGRRHDGAQAALARAVDAGWIADGACAFEHADARHADLAGATVLFANSTCFPASLLEALARRIARLPPPVTFATMQTLEGRAARWFENAGTARCATSWDSRTMVNLYRLPPR
jgi:hypothetical protein